MTTPNTTPSAEERILSEFDLDIEAGLIWKVSPEATDKMKKLFRESAKKALKSYKKEILEEVERELKDLEDYEYTGESALIPIGQVLDLLNSLK